MAVWDVPTLHPQLQLQMPLDKPLAAAVSFHFHTYIKWFIRNCSSMATPLTALTSLKSPFVWSLVAEKASSELNHLFTSVPILIFPDPLLQFVVEVDSSHSGWISFAQSDTDFFLHLLWIFLLPRGRTLVTFNMVCKLYSKYGKPKEMTAGRLLLIYYNILIIIH